MKGKEAYCDFCAMEVEYDDHGNCSQCGKHVHDIAFDERNIIDAARYRVARGRRRLSEKELRVRVQNLRSALSSARKANMHLKKYNHQLNTSLKRMHAFVRKLKKTVDEGCGIEYVIER